MKKTFIGDVIFYIATLFIFMSGTWLLFQQHPVPAYGCALAAFLIALEMGVNAGKRNPFVFERDEHPAVWQWIVLSVFVISLAIGINAFAFLLAAITDGSSFLIFVLCVSALPMVVLIGRCLRNIRILRALFDYAE